MGGVPQANSTLGRAGRLASLSDASRCLEAVVAPVGQSTLVLRSLFWRHTSPLAADATFSATDHFNRWLPLAGHSCRAVLHFASLAQCHLSRSPDRNQLPRQRHYPVFRQANLGFEL